MVTWKRDVTHTKNSYVGCIQSYSNIRTVTVYKNKFYLRYFWDIIKQWAMRYYLLNVCYNMHIIVQVSLIKAKLTTL